MARTTEFTHSTLGKLLNDELLKVPDFQRTYSWEAENVEEYWNDILGALNRDEDYFLGTVVLSEIEDDRSFKNIVDGQQRIATTALLMIAIQRQLSAIGKNSAAEKIYSSHIADFDLEREEVVSKLYLSSEDQQVYQQIIANEKPPADSRLKGRSQRLLDAFNQLSDLVEDFSGESDQYSELVALSKFLDDRAQVLLAVASGLSEAYVIFETLNDRGAALTTADLLKNYFLSNAGRRRVRDALDYWTRISASFENGDKLVSFIKSHYTSRYGTVQKKRLYSALQEKLGKNSNEILKYLKELLDSIEPYQALNSLDASFWSGISTDVRDEIVAHRRFNIEAPFAMYLAAQRQWRPVEFCNLIKAGTSWAIRVSLVGGLGGGTAEKLYGDAAKGISDGSLKNVEDVKALVSSRGFVPSNAQFSSALLTVSNNSRAKYLLAMVEKEYWKENGFNAEAMPPWDSKGVSVEHIFPKGTTPPLRSDGTTSLISELQLSLPNLTLLERSINNSLGDGDFHSKQPHYEKSSFKMTVDLKSFDDFNDDAIAVRRDQIIRLSLKAWPI